MEGLNIVLKSLYDVTLQNVEPQNGELWSDEVYKLVHPFRQFYVLLYSAYKMFWSTDVDVYTVCVVIYKLQMVAYDT